MEVRCIQEKKGSNFHCEIKVEFKINFISFLFLQVLMGVFFYTQSLALLDDLPIDETYSDAKTFYSDAQNGYSLVSIH